MNNNDFHDKIKKTLAELTNLTFEDLKIKTSNHNIIFIIDMVNDFAKKGKLFDASIHNLITPITKLAKKTITTTKIIAFNDAHNEHSPELETFPVHCLENTKEAELVEQLQQVTNKDKKIEVIKKNSTNGFFAFDFKPNLQWDNIIIVGCCTDICIYQFALSCKTWFNQHNKKVNVIVPMTMTSTYDSDDHPAAIFNDYAWYSMLKNGIKVVKDITFNK